MKLKKLLAMLLAVMTILSCTVGISAQTTTDNTQQSEVLAAAQPRYVACPVGPGACEYKLIYIDYKLDILGMIYRADSCYGCPKCLTIMHREIHYI